MAAYTLGALGQTGSTSTSGQLDVQGIVEQLINAKRQPIRDLEVYQTFYEAKKTAFQDLNTKLSAVERSLFAINTAGFESKSVTSSDATVLTASAGSTAQSGTYDLVVKQLAKAQSNASTPLASATTSLLTDGSTFTISQGDTTKAIAVTGDTRSLNGLRNAINSSDLDVTATVINNGSQYYLQITSDLTGTENAVTITDTGVGTAMTTRQAAQDAQFYLNTDPLANPTGYLSRQTNSISDVITGLTLQLKKTDASPVTLTIEPDTSGAAEKISSFVEQFNLAITSLNEQFNFDQNTGRAGVLSSEATARKAQADLLGIVSSRVSGLTESDTYKTLSTIGISMANDGTLSVDSSKLDNALNNHIDNVMRLFKNQGTSSNSEISYSGKSRQTVAGKHAIQISAAAEKAMVAADRAIAGTLGADASANETLTLAVSGKSVNVALTYDMTISGIVEAINTSFTTAGIDALATQTSNTLSISTERYGSTQSLAVSSTKTGLFTSSKTDNGVDVAGTLGGNAASGAGRTLTGTAGDSKGLMVFVESQTVGDKGEVSLTYGVGEQLRQRMYDLTFPYDGLVAKNVEALDTQMGNIDKKIADINRNLASEETLLIQQFSRANEALSQLQYLQSTISNNFKQ